MLRSALINPGLSLALMVALAMGASLGNGGPETETETETGRGTQTPATRKAPRVPPTPRWGANMQMLRRHNSRCDLEESPKGKW